MTHHGPWEARRKIGAEECGPPPRPGPRRSRRRPRCPIQGAGTRRRAKMQLCAARSPPRIALNHRDPGRQKTCGCSCGRPTPGTQLAGSPAGGNRIPCRDGVGLGKNVGGRKSGLDEGFNDRGRTWPSSPAACRTRSGPALKGWFDPGKQGGHASQSRNVHAQRSGWDRPFRDIKIGVARKDFFFCRDRFRGPARRHPVVAGAYEHFRPRAKRRERA